MNRLLKQTTIYAFLLLANITLAGNTDPSTFTDKMQNEGISFTENKGQIHDQNWNPRPDVIFGGTSGSMVYHMRTNGISYQQNRVDSWKEMDDSKSEEKIKRIDQMTTYRTDIYWEGINTNYRIEKEETLSGYDNYYNVPEGIEPALFVKSYKSVWLRNLYEGIDLHYYGAGTTLKYDFIVEPHADYHQIKIRIEGAELQIKEDGSLQLITPLGIIEEGKPVAYQGNTSIKANWELNENILTIKLGKYNKEETLYIDPPVREWGTYYGGVGQDDGYGCTTDNNGNVYLAGRTTSTTAIATAGAHQTTRGVGGSFYDAFLAKFNSSGVRQWATYYGSGERDDAFDCTTDGSGNVYLAGKTQSTTGIATAGAHQTIYGGGTVTNYDAFLVQFNSAGVRQWATYYGGTTNDEGYGCTTDASGNVYLAGWTKSTTAIATAGAHQTTFGGGFWHDAFLVKFNSSGVRQWGTYYGSSSIDEGNSCAVDGSGNVYLTGRTSSTTAMATAGAHQAIYGGGSDDAFLVKFNSAGIRQWATYYGGSDIERGLDCALDASGDVYLTGVTTSGTAINTLGAHQPTYGGSNDAFLVKFNTSGVRQWATYYGGPGIDAAESCAVDNSGNVYIAGYTYSDTTIATVGAHQEIHGGGSADAYLVKFNSSGVREWGTYYGGTNWDRAYGCAVDNIGNIYMAGFTGSSTSIATVGAHQVTLGSNQEAFLVKFAGCLVSYDTIYPLACEAYTSPGGNNYNITGMYIDTLFGANAAGCDSIITINLTIDSIDITNATADICLGDSILLGGFYQTIGGVYYDTLIGLNVNGCDSIVITTLSITSTAPGIRQTFNECEGFSITVGTNTYSTTGIYTDINGCDTIITDLTINPLPIITFVKTDDNCEDSIGSITIDTALGATINTYTWNNGNTNSSITNLSEGIYTIIIVDINGCSDTEQITINNLLLDCNYPIYIPNAFSPNGDGFNEYFLTRGLSDIENFNMRIYNRWGVKVFETDDVNFAWDGTQKGKASPVGVYVYYINIDFKSNTAPFVAKGNITLVR